MSSASTEDAKRLAIKEEQYDPGYEDAYGGAYTDRAAGGGPDQNQTNGHCAFSSGNVSSHRVHTVLDCVFVSSACLSALQKELRRPPPPSRQTVSSRTVAG